MSRYDRKYDKVVITGLPNTTKVNDILNSVLSQMSDGMWENSHYMRSYWEFIDFTEDGNIHLCDDSYCYAYNYLINNKFHEMSDKEVKRFFARKIRTIVRENLKNDYVQGIRDKYYELWHFDPTYRCVYKHDPNNDTLKIIEKLEKQIDENLKQFPFKVKKLFNENNNTNIIYLGKTITVSDAYKVYQILMED